jgi:ribosomal protein S18 acetylase RimI-like enzyme
MPKNITQTSIRQFEDKDEAEVAGVWFRSGKAAYTYLPHWQSLTLGQATRDFPWLIRANNQLWVATLGEEIVAFLAINGTYIDRMYVNPAHWRRGWGTKLIEHAKSLSPQGLELHTHQENLAARALYEKHGFRAVKFSLSPAPELVPDVEYHWRPIQK